MIFRYRQGKTTNTEVIITVPHKGKYTVCPFDSKCCMAASKSDCMTYRYNTQNTVKREPHAHATMPAVLFIKVDLYIPYH